VTGAACGDDTGADTDGSGRSESLLVLAASSLTGAFTEIEAAYEDAHPDVDVVLTSDSSSTLAGQVAEGGPGDVLATAAPENMDDAIESGNVTGEPLVFAENRGAIAVPTGAEAIVTPEDLEGDVLLAVCAEDVPCRLVADELFAALGIDPELDTEEENVAAVVTKLEAGEVDAGVVYVTDDLASDAIEAIDLGDVVVSTDYPIVAISDSAASRSFVEFVTGAEGRAILEAAGFVTP
jgi:molybdate transport system substrate-binding protein